MLRRWLPLFASVLLASPATAADAYVVRVETIEIQGDPDAPVDELLRKMVVRPIEVTVSVGDTFDESQVVDGHTLHIQGQVEQAIGRQLKLATFSYGIESRGASMTMAGGPGFVGEPAIKGGGTSTPASAAGKRTMEFSRILDVAWPPPHDRASTLKRRLLLDRARTDLIRKILVEQQTADRARAKAAASLLELVRTHLASGETRVAQALLDSFSKQFDPAGNHPEAAPLRARIAAALARETPQPAGVP